MSTDFYPEASSTGDIDLRVEMHNTIWGSLDMVAQGKQVLWYHMTNDKCACWSGLEGSSARADCPYCKGLGYMFTQTIETLCIYPGVAPIYKPGATATGIYPQSAYGYTDPNKATGFCEYTVIPNYETYTYNLRKVMDILHELKVDSTGRTVSPFVFTSKWKLLTLTPIRGDFGRVEYFELSLDKSVVD
jgi:hypothetical protein